MLFRNRLETFSRADRLGGSEKKHAPIAQGEMKERQDFVLRFRLEINEEIATANEINVGKGRVRQNIVNREHHAVAQFVGDLVMMIFLVKNRANRSGATSASIVSG